VTTARPPDRAGRRADEAVGAGVLGAVAGGAVATVPDAVIRARAYLSRVAEAPAPAP